MARRNIFILIIANAGFLFVALLIAFYLIAMSTKLPGRRGGPQDAFRHTYASAVTTKYLSPYLVKFVTYVSERNPNSPYDQMDIHNNNIGIKIGSSSENIYKEVFEKVKNGQVNAFYDDTITWLPEEKWSDGL